VNIDNIEGISFVSTPQPSTPEPSSFALLIMGAIPLMAGAGAFDKFRRRRFVRKLETRKIGQA
jgi:hypothetical protein